MTIKDLDERSFYEIEAVQQGWSLSELKRQKASALYERLALSRDKDGIRQLAAKGQVIAKPEDVFREPYVLEFLGLDEQSGYSESDLETATDRFYPDFLCQMEDGRILVVEYKNTRDRDLPDNIEKRQLGELWQRRSEGKGLFIMPHGKDWTAIRAKLT